MNKCGRYENRHTLRGQGWPLFLKPSVLKTIRSNLLQAVMYGPTEYPYPWTLQMGSNYLVITSQRLEPLYLLNGNFRDSSNTLIVIMKFFSNPTSLAKQA